MKKMWIEKGVLAIAVIFLCVSTLKAVNSSEPIEKVNLVAKLHEVETALNENNKIELPKIDYLEQLQKGWMDLPQASEMSNSLMYQDTINLISYTEEPKQPLPVILPPCLNEIKVDPAQPDKMVVSWNVGMSTAQVTGYKLYRKAEGEKAYKILAELPPNTTDYTDTAIQPETTYEYYITSLTNDKVEGGKPESAPSGKVTAMAPEIAYPDSEGEGGVSFNKLTGKFTIRIKKYTTGGKLVSAQQLSVQKGDKITAIDKGVVFFTNYSLSEVEDYVDMSAGFPREFKRVTFTNSRTNKTRTVEIRIYK